MLRLLMCRFGVKSLMVSKLLPHIIKMLDDQNSAVSSLSWYLHWQEDLSAATEILYKETGLNWTEFALHTMQHELKLN